VFDDPCEFEVSVPLLVVTALILPFPLMFFTDRIGIESLCFDIFFSLWCERIASSRLDFDRFLDRV
jgi:hypothetical protein